MLYVNLKQVIHRPVREYIFFQSPWPIVRKTAIKYVCQGTNFDQL